MKTLRKNLLKNYQNIEKNLTTNSNKRIKHFKYINFQNALSSNFHSLLTKKNIIDQLIIHTNSNKKEKKIFFFNLSSFNYNFKNNIKLSENYENRSKYIYNIQCF